MMRVLAVLAAACVAPEGDGTGADSPVPTADTGTSTIPVDVPQTLGLVAFTSSYVRLALPEGGTRGFHLHDSLTAFGNDLPFAADFEGDGLDGVGILDADGTVRYGPGNASGRLPEQWSSPPGRLPVTGDFDGDGVDDFGSYSFATGAVELWSGPPKGDVWAAHSVPAGRYVVSGDFDGDGVHTLVSYDPYTGWVTHHPFDGGAEIDVASGRFGYPVVADLDGNGRDALGVLQWDLELAWLDDAGDTVALQAVDSHGTFFQWPLAGRWSTAGALEESDGYPWPTTNAVQAGFDATLLQGGFAAAEALGTTNSMLVVQRGQLVREAYWRGFDASMANNVKSVSKSILSTLLGIAAADGLLAHDDLLSDHLAGGPGFPLGDLMSMSAGLAWNEATDLGQMIGAPNWVDYVLSRPVVAAPGTIYNYSTGNTHVGSALLQEVTGQSTSEFARERLFGPLGISFTRWDVDPSGVDMGGAEVWMRPRDLARFGQLYLDGGEVEGVPLVSAAWVTESLTRQVAHYGWWWRAWVLDGAEAWIALGYGGQVVAVVPDRDLVVVITSEWSVDYGASNDQFGALYQLLNEQIVAAAPKVAGP